jgi:signal transduction histidine kinase
MGPSEAMEKDAAPTRLLAWGMWILGTLTLIVSVGYVATHDRSGDGWSIATQSIAFAALGVVGLVIALHRPANPIGWIYLAIWIGVGVIFGGAEAWVLFAENTGLPGADFAGWLTNWAWVPIFTVMLTYPFLLFPDGRLPSPRWRPMLRLIAVATVLWSAAFAFEDADYTDALDRPTANPYTPAGWAPFFNVAREVLAVVVIGLVGMTVASLVLRYRRSHGDEREQIRWLLFAASLVFLWLLLPVQHGNGGWPDIVQGFVLATIPVAIGVAILHYRLYDIDLVLRKTIVIGVSAAFISIVYVAIVVGLGAVVADDLALRVAATAVIAVAFQPVRGRANRWANRLVYGSRATPYEVLTRFGERVGDTYATDDVLPRVARVIAEGTAAERAEVWLRLGEELRPSASWPVDVPRQPLRIVEDALPAIPGDRVAPVRHQGELLGAISVTKPANEALAPSEAELIDRLADQAGLVLANARLTADLEARLDQIAVQAAELRESRQRIVAAQDEERRRLERNIHDGAQQHLVALAVKLRLAKTAMGADDERGRRMLAEIREEIDAALDTLRSLALGIYPPLLEEQGLAAALAAQYVRTQLPVRLDTDGIGRYPIEIEAAVYFSALEALQNAAKYAAANAISITLRERDGALTFTVRDDGVGFDPATRADGTGLAGLRDRLAVFGGDAAVSSTPGAGTTVRGRVPLVRGAA